VLTAPDPYHCSANIVYWPFSRAAFYSTKYFLSMHIATVQDTSRMSQLYTRANGSEHAIVSTTVPGCSKVSPLRFLDLPAEIRGLVYAFIFQGTKLKHVGRHPDSEARDARGRRLMGTGLPLRWDAHSQSVMGIESPLWSPAIAIIFVSKLCYQEAKSVLLTEAMFYLDIERPGPARFAGPDGTTWDPTSANLVLSPAELSTVRHVNIVTYPWFRGYQGLTDLLDSLPSLETAVFYQGHASLPRMNATVADLSLDTDGVLNTKSLELVQSNLEEIIGSASLWRGRHAYSPTQRERLNTLIELLRSWDARNRSFEPILVLALMCRQKTTPDGKPQGGFWFFVSGSFGNQHPLYELTGSRK
jgi:hypothetical protein